MIIQFCGHTIRTEPADGVDPGHQNILIAPADFEGLAIMCALTGVLPVNQVQVNDERGIVWIMAPHNALADRRITQLVDICVDLRFSAPAMLQLRLQLDESTDAT